MREELARNQSREVNDPFADATELFVTWKRCASVSSCTASCIPPAREMHASVVQGNTLYILGGRTSNGELLQDVWSCELQAADDGDGVSVQWRRRPEMSLPLPMCAAQAAAGSDGSIILVGGFTTNGINNTVYVATTCNSGWREVSIADTSADTSLRGRFGHSVCQAPSWLISPSGSSVRGVVLFGGVDAERDYGDCWIICESE